MTTLTDLQCLQAYDALAASESPEERADYLQARCGNKALFCAAERQDIAVVWHLINMDASLFAKNDNDVVFLDFCLERGFSLHPWPRLPATWGIKEDAWLDAGMKMFRQIILRPNAANQLGDVLRAVPMHHLMSVFLPHMGQALDSLNIMEQLLWHGLVETLLRHRTPAQIVALYSRYILRAEPVYGALVLDAALERARPGQGIRSRAPLGAATRTPPKQAQQHDRPSPPRLVRLPRVAFSNLIPVSRLPRQTGLQPRRLHFGPPTSGVIKEFFNL